MKKTTVLLVSLVIFSQCNVLERDPLTSITPENFYRNADDAESAIAGCYDALQGADYYGESMNIVGEMPSDNCTSTNGDVVFLDIMTWNPLSGYVNRLYQAPYRTINRANSVIKYVPAINMPATRRDQILGEAHFLRALSYFNLVRLYGGVPLRTEPVESGENTALARATAEQVYTQIEADLETAERLAATTYGNSDLDRARATKGAVNALQARVLLTQRKWSGAQAAAEEVLNNPLYGTRLTPNFNDLWPPKNKQESIWEIQYAGNADPGFTLPDLLLPSPPASFSFPKFNIPETAFITEYADTARDSRFRNNGRVQGGISYSSVVWGGRGEGNDNGWFVYKWRNTNFFTSNDNYPVFRLAEMYLIAAEAANEQGGPTQTALERLNAVRTRAGLPALSLSDLPTRAAFRDEVDRQRRLELAFEGERWFDLLRYTRHEQADPTATHEVTALDLIAARRGSRDANYLLFPIPQYELNNNPLIEQNDGY
ncbi:MAG: RagB/SusD family nutrient uptake outer membrane protein [Cytophagales bacterium]|nr:RagB/SusD family nutrient uptake outer membrane protein [Cytophagales bacterium]